MERRFRFSKDGISEVMPDGTTRPVTGEEFRIHQFGASVSDLRRLRDEALLAYYEAKPVVEETPAA